MISKSHNQNFANDFCQALFLPTMLIKVVCVNKVNYNDYDIPLDQTFPCSVFTLKLSFVFITQKHFWVWSFSKIHVGIHKR